MAKVGATPKKGLTMSPESWLALVRPATPIEADSYAGRLTSETREFFHGLSVPELARMLAYRRAVVAGFFNEAPR